MSTSLPERVLNRVLYTFYRGVRRALLMRPHRSARGIGRWLGGLGFRLLRSHRRRADENVARVFPDLSTSQRRDLVLRTYRHLGSYSAELISCTRFSSEDLLALFEIEGWDHIESVQQEGRPVLFTGGHFGYWELALYPLGLRIGNVHAVFRPPSNPLMEAEAEALRKRIGVSAIAKRGAALDCYRVCQEGGSVAMIMDQHNGPPSGVRIPFLGHPAWTSPLMAALSIRTNAPVVPITCRPLEEGRYHFRAHPAVFPEGRDRAELTSIYQQPLEADILERPEMWLWMHRRWRDV